MSVYNSLLNIRLSSNRFVINEPSHNRSFGLDCVRTFAISLVLISHFSAKTLGALGFVGVELFFALSGYLIGQILWRSYSQTNHWTIGHLINFWSRRWWRTLPNYYLFFIIMLLYHAYNGGLPHISRLLDSLWFGQNLLKEESFGFFGVAWSLCIEEWFYLLFPSVLFILDKTGMKSKMSFITTLTIFFLLSILIRDILVKAYGGETLRTVTFARLDSIASGVAVAFLISIMKHDLKWRRITFLVGLVLLASIVSFSIFSNKKYDMLSQYPVLLVLIPLGFSLILPLVSLLKPLVGFFSFITKCVNSLSLWSYSIYLSHIPIMWIVYYITDCIRGNILGNLISKIIGIVMTLSISSILFKYFETPLIRMRPSELK
jgi:peptidoglycan/LPS O-acetylase OafA/YrhL